MNKRARTDDDGIPAEILDVSSCEKDSTFFLEDGNIILLAGSTLFRIHKSVLSMHSQIFRDMFNVASGNDHLQELFDGVPVVRVSDSVNNLRNLVMALYDRSYFQLGKKTTFDVIEALLSMSTKYMIDGLHKDVVVQLSTLYPREFERLTNNKHIAAHSAPQCIRAISMGRRYDIPLILPAAFFFCCCLSLEQILSGVRDKNNEETYQLSPDDTRSCLIARELMYDPRHGKNPYSFLYWFPSPSDDCTSREDCRLIFPATVQCTFSNNFFCTCDYTFSDKFLDPKAVLDPEDQSNFCYEYRAEWRRRIQNGQDALWDDLAGMLGLPPWELMLADRAVA